MFEQTRRQFIGRISGGMVALAWASNLGFCSENGTKVWIGHYNPEHLVTQNLNWDFLKNNLDGINYFINMIAFRTPQDDILQLVKALEGTSIEIGIECGYFDWKPVLTDFRTPNPKGISDQVRELLKPGVGEKTAQEEMAKLALLIDYGRVPDWICLDGPIRRLKIPGQDVGRTGLQGIGDYRKVAAEIILYMQTWKKKHPKVRFALITNFPNWGWKGEPSYFGTRENPLQYGDYFEALTILLEECRKAQMLPDAIRADNPLDYLLATADTIPEPARDPKTIDWMKRLLELETMVESAGLEFQLITNTTAGNISAELFNQGTLQYVDRFKEAGGSPGTWVVESWYKHPERVGPEEDSQTLAWVTNEVIRKVKTGG